jgi:hypothetical protein
MALHVAKVEHVTMHNANIIIIAIVALLAAAPALGDDAMLQPGDPFPAFELPAHDGSTVSNADLEGTAFLLFFYPKANTGG